ncbi:pseudouridine synthase domain-containing protein [Levilactobacillus suantsaiihabitans]|uniref:16S rRNA pseudouridylate synthase n=1 Tax=Levilactobacillus suantsaiihabitans TaxID=2487722 RepID=A0A4Z0JB55_9LACO|nr:16S rRNA pseudouridylate synthase [Levilactobacillus suantsaiihabitans]TGD18869.1 16S rRNA pseudouridylate synthase [Levilactobacillus suantsaiihabitans]
MNIERYLTAHRQGTPGQIFRLLRQGRVTVDDQVVDSPRTDVTSDQQVRVDGLTVTGRQPQYLLFNKPVGFVLNLEPTSQRSLGSLLNSLDQQRSLKALANLPKEAVGLVLASDDERFLADVARQNWRSTLQIVLAGTTVPDLSANVAFQDVTSQVDTVHQTVTVALTTTDVAAGVSALSNLAHANEPVVRTQFGPVALPVDLAVGTYRGLFANEIDALNGPLDLKTE